LFLEKNVGGEKAVFAGGFAIFWCFVVVKTWCVCGGMRGECGVLCGVFLARKDANFAEFIFGIFPFWE